LVRARHRHVTAIYLIERVLCQASGTGGLGGLCCP
jgi:hypothetical protein